eukprot:m.129185 g.129185  ORF g.129185 m.129185 type:complete len:146 (-) comp22312_c0_seq3:836-1273(-)
MQLGPTHDGPSSRCLCLGRRLAAKDESEQVEHDPEVDQWHRHGGGVVWECRAGRWHLDEVPHHNGHQHASVNTVDAAVPSGVSVRQPLGLSGEVAELAHGFSAGHPFVAGLSDANGKFHAAMRSATGMPVIDPPGFRASGPSTVS